MEKLLKLRKSWPVLAICAFYVYLAFHALSGSQGLMSWVDYRSDIERLSLDLDEARSVKAKLELHVEGLRAQNLNLDLLDIRTRKHTYTSRANELTIWLDP